MKTKLIPLSRSIIEGETWRAVSAAFPKDPQGIPHYQEFKSRFEDAGKGRPNVVLLARSDEWGNQQYLAFEEDPDDEYPTIIGSYADEDFEDPLTSIEAICRAGAEQLRQEASAEAFSLAFVVTLVAALLGFMGLVELSSGHLPLVTIEPFPWYVPYFGFVFGFGFIVWLLVRHYGLRQVPVFGY